MSLKTLWDGNVIDVADCLTQVSFDSYNDWCSNFLSIVNKFIKDGFNFYSTECKKFVDNIRPCGSYEKSAKLQMTFIGLKEDVFTHDNANCFVKHIETDYDDDVYTLSIPTFFFMTIAESKHVANCLHWLDANRQYILPLSITEINMVKQLTAENSYVVDKVEKARVRAEIRKKAFELVFWWNQYVEWRDEFEDDYIKNEDVLKQYSIDHADIIKSCIVSSFTGKIYINDKEVDTMPKEVKELERLKAIRYRWWAESDFFNDTLRAVKKNLTREEINEALWQDYA